MPLRLELREHWRPPRSCENQRYRQPRHRREPEAREIFPCRKAGLFFLSSDQVPAHAETPVLASFYLWLRRTRIDSRRTGCSALDWLQEPAIPEG